MSIYLARSAISAECSRFFFSFEGDAFSVAINKSNVNVLRCYNIRAPAYRVSYGFIGDV